MYYLVCNMMYSSMRLLFGMGGAALIPDGILVDAVQSARLFRDDYYTLCEETAQYVWWSMFFFPCLCCCLPQQ